MGVVRPDLHSFLTWHHDTESRLSGKFGLGYWVIIHINNTISLQNRLFASYHYFLA